MTKKLNINKDIVATAFDLLLKQEGIDKDGVPFTGGVNDHTPFRTTQYEAVTAGGQFVRHDENGHKGYFEIATGIGKTVIFLSLVKESHFEAQRRGIYDFRSVIVVPTTQLVGQTKKSFEAYVPNLKDKIGLYGDGHKDLSKPVTIITYDSWRALVERGVLNYENTDLLISDEAHRGLSDRQVDNFFSAFGDETISFAFTATSEFDTEKTVEKTHGTKIYSKKLADGVRGNELAAYIQTQLHVIGIATPDLTDEFNEEAKRFNEDPNYRARLKQEAWNRFALEQFKSGKDDHTGDYLHENKAAFFVADTTHADKLEEALNGDEKLQFTAKARGLKGVSVAIHSKLPPSEQKRRMEDYLAGKYMAVVGDSQFKEGFDYPELKTIFDYPRGSLVDKSQILGRGGRKWWNEAKERWEGMTFIDTVIYFDEPDTENAERNRENALRYAILASSVIDDTYILSEAEEKKKKESSQKPSGGGDAYGPIYPNDLKVESYTKLEEIKSIYAEIAYLNKEHWVEFTEEMSGKLHHLIDSKNLGAIRIANALKIIHENNVPESYTIASWLKGVDRIDSNKFNLVIDFLEHEETPTMIAITKEMKEYLIYLMKDKNLGSMRLADQLNKIHGDDFVNYMLIENSFRGNAVINNFKWKAMIHYLETAPSVGLYTLTKHDKLNLEAHMQRIGMGPKRIADALNELHGDGFIDQKYIERWKLPNTKKIMATSYKAVIDFVVSQPNIVIDEKIILTDHLKGKLLQLMETKGIGSVKLARMLNADHGKNYIELRAIEKWAKDIKAKSASKNKFETVIKLLGSLPDKQNKPSILLTTEIKMELRERMTRSAYSARLIANSLNALHGSNFIGLNDINNWIGSNKSAPEHLFKIVIDFLKSQQDAQPKAKSKGPRFPELG